jgi:Type II secretion system (T2SS), protein E, N-terminal domain
MSLSLRAMLPVSSALTTLSELPSCANMSCPRPPTLWQRWWARHEGLWLQKRWYCSPECFQEGLLRRLNQSAAFTSRPPAQPNHTPLGLVLLSQGAITAIQLRAALESQRAAGGGRLGEWLIRMGAISEPQVTAALAVQQGCPVFAARDPQSLPATMHWPAPLAQSYLAVPVFYNPAQSDLYVGFLEGVHHGFLYALEQMLQCRTQPCILTPPAFRENLDRKACPGESETIVIQQRQTAIEMTRTIANYAAQVHAERCGITCCEDHLWIRLTGLDGLHVDFLFRLPVCARRL